MAEVKLPSCCAIFEDDTGLRIDFWTATSSGDDFTDYMCGGFHAAEVIQYSRDANRPEFLDNVIMQMALHMFERLGFIDKSRKLERGFLDKIARDDPATFDRLTMRFLNRNPHIRH